MQRLLSCCASYKLLIAFINELAKTNIHLINSVVEIPVIKHIYTFADPQRDGLLAKREIRLEFLFHHQGDFEADEISRKKNKLACIRKNPYRYQRQLVAFFY